MGSTAKPKINRAYMLGDHGRTRPAMFRYARQRAATAMEFPEGGNLRAKEMNVRMATTGIATTSMKTNNAITSGLAVRLQFTGMELHPPKGQPRTSTAANELLQVGGADPYRIGNSEVRQSPTFTQRVNRGGVNPKSRGDVADGEQVRRYRQ
jgi:hypothetical protein